MKKIIFVLAGFLLTACDGGIQLCEHTDFSFTVTNYNGAEVRTDGLYHSRPEAGAANPVVEYFVLYNNGIMLDGKSVGFADLDSRYQSIVDAGQTYGKDCKSCWGAFDINQQSITLERWITDPCGEPVFQRTGTILNDSTLVLKTEVEIDKGVESSTLTVSDTFDFRYAAVKPDSTNPFIPF